MKVIPNYHPPSDYRRPTKTQEKVYVPVNDYPEINFSMIANLLTLLPALSVVYSASIILTKLVLVLREQVVDLKACANIHSLAYLPIVFEDSHTNT